VILRTPAAFAARQTVGSTRKHIASQYTHTQADTKINLAGSIYRTTPASRPVYQIAAFIDPRQLYQRRF